MWWDNTPDVMVAGLYWEWMVRKGREDGKKLGHDYIEVRFEQLISDPRSTLAILSGFVEQELDYDHILKVGIGSVSDPNTSFKNQSNGVFNPLGRWKKGLTPEHLQMFESVGWRHPPGTRIRVGHYGGQPSGSSGFEANAQDIPQVF